MKGNEESFISVELGKAFLSSMNSRKKLFSNYLLLLIRIQNSCLQEQLLRGKITFYLSFRMGLRARLNQTRLNTTNSLLSMRCREKKFCKKSSRAFFVAMRERKSRRADDEHA